MISTENATQSIDFENEATKIIYQMGVPAHIKGYQYLKMAILMTIEDSEIINPAPKIFYSSIAKKYHTTPSRVERYIRHAIKVAWSRNDVDTLHSYFGHTVQNKRQKPTPLEFIEKIAEELKQKKT